MFKRRQADWALQAQHQPTKYIKQSVVILAKARIQLLKIQDQKLDPRLRGDDDGAQKELFIIRQSIPHTRLS